MWSLIARNLMRNPMRAGLSATSLTVALLLFMLLQAIDAKFSATVESTEPFLLVLPKHRSGYQVPLTHVEKVKAVDGVVAVTPLQSLRAYYREPAVSIGATGVYADALAQMLQYTGRNVSPEALARFANTRTGALVSRSLADAHGWQVGDTVALQSRTFFNKDRSRVWTFDIVGVVNPERDSEVMYFHFDYLGESAVGEISGTSMLNAMVDDPANALQVARQIDETLAITPQPTSTITTDHASRSWARQLGDVGTIITFILGAVFFSVLIVTANGAVQRMRERMPEHATMQTLGFTNGRIIGLMFGENVVLCLLCGGTAIAAAYLLESAFNDNLGSYVGQFEMTGYHSMLTLVAALGTAVTISLAPAVALWRLDIVTALGRD